MKPKRRANSRKPRIDSSKQVPKSLLEKKKEKNEKSKHRMQRYRLKLYSDKKLHDDLKERDRLRKQ